MSEHDKSPFRFFPRPEAHPMIWVNLQLPVQNAVQALLLRIGGAMQKDVKIARTTKDDEASEIAANCFLVYGDRGTGKTTVLLGAKDACNHKKHFFEGIKKDSADDVCYDAMLLAEDLRHKVVWLDILDLEPLPSRSNLLTMVLTRVRNALDLSDSEQPSPAASSIFEESPMSARQQLSLLINDATLMWENISESDTRSRANRQIAAADIYAQFQKRFHVAIHALSQELGRRSGSAETYRSIILPIDNIDRSTEHLYNIVKLAQMVSCPRLWLVMAGDRQDVETFLERAYWKELIQIGETAGATGKTGAGGEDEALIMARRQAAAASHKLLPPSHRIEVQLLTPQQTLGFKRPGVPEQSAADKSIRELLGDVRLITKKEAEEEERKEGETQRADTTKKETEKCPLKIRLLDLFDTASLLQAMGKKETDVCLTSAAELGLHLSVRGALDLWQLAYWVINDHTILSYHKAEKIARTMLRNILTESTVSSKVGQRLQDQIIRRNPEEGTMLDYASTNSPLEVRRLTSLDFDLQPQVKEVPRLQGEQQAGYVVRSRLNVHKFEAWVLKLPHSQKGDDREPGGERLPDLVAAWLIVLHDTLVWGAEHSGTIDDPKIRPPSIVRCKHDGLVCNTKNQHQRLKSIEPEWTVPGWNSFVMLNICEQLWRHFLSEFKTAASYAQPDREACLPRLLATGWVACVLETFLAFANLWKWEDPLPSNILNGLLNGLTNTTEGDSACGGAMAEAIRTAEEAVMQHATTVYEVIFERTNKCPSEVYRAAGDAVTRPMRDWLECQLPLLLSQVFVPTVYGDVETVHRNAARRAEEIIALLTDEHDEETASAQGWTKLAESWKDNSRFLLADLEQKWAELFPEGEFEPFGPFADLLRHWYQSGSDSK